MSGSPAASASSRSVLKTMKSFSFSLIYSRTSSTRVLAREGVGVVPVRQQHHADVHPLGQHHRDAAQGGVDARGVAVVHDGDVLRELLDQAHLLHRERGAAGGHDVGDAELVHHHHVHVALHQDAAVLPGDVALGEIDAQQVAALDVDLRLGRIDVFGRIVRAERAAAERDHAPAHRVDREHHALAELVRQRAVVVLHRQAGAQQVLILVAGGAGGVHQGRPPRRRPAQPPVLDRGILDAAGAEIGIAHGAAFAVLELVGEELPGEFRHQQQALAALAPGNLFGGLLRPRRSRCGICGPGSAGPPHRSSAPAPSRNPRPCRPCRSRSICRCPWRAKHRRRASSHCGTGSRPRNWPRGASASRNRSPRPRSARCPESD